MSLGSRYDMFDTKSKMLAQTFARILHDMTAQTEWDDICNRRTNWTQTTGQKKRFCDMLINLADEIFGRKAFENQTDALEAGMPYPSSMALSKMAIRLFRINETLKYLGNEAEAYSFPRLHRILRKTLKGEARLKYIEQGGLKNSTKAEVIEKLLEVEEILDEQADLRNERKANKNNRDHNRNGNEDKYDPDTDTDDEDANNGDQKHNQDGGNNGGGLKNPCGFHKDHEWKDCYLNKNSKNHDESRANKEAAERREVKKEAEINNVGGDANTTPQKNVRFLADFDYDSDDESVNTVASNGSHFMMVHEEKKDSKLKPITIVAL